MLPKKFPSLPRYPIISYTIDFDVIECSFYNVIIYKHKADLTTHKTATATTTAAESNDTRDTKRPHKTGTVGRRPMYI